MIGIVSFICVLGAVLVNLSGITFTMPNTPNEWVNMAVWVTCSIMFVVCCNIGFQNIHDSFWMRLFAPTLLCFSMTLSFNAASRLASSHQAVSDRRVQLNESIDRANTRLDNGCQYEPAHICKVSEQNEIIRKADAELRALPLVGKVSKANSLLSWVLGLGPDLCNAMMGIVAGLRRRRPEIVEREQELKKQRKEQRASNVYEFKKKVRAKTSSMGKKSVGGMKKIGSVVAKLKPKFPTLGRNNKKGGKSTKKPVNNSGKQRKPRVCTDKEMARLWEISQAYFSQHGKKISAQALKEESGMHTGKIANYNKRVREGYNGPKKEARA